MNKKDEKSDLLDLIEHFDQEQFENRYLEHADLKDLVEERYAIVQLANEYITVAEPRKKYKDESTQQEAIEDLEFLLWVIKQLGLLSSGILISAMTESDCRLIPLGSPRMVISRLGFATFMSVPSRETRIESKWWVRRSSILCP